MSPILNLGSGFSEHCVLFGQGHIMAQSTDPPDIEQSQKYRVIKTKMNIPKPLVKTYPKVKHAFQGHC